jgi:uncharacterized phosphosugar-binding protein
MRVGHGSALLPVADGTAMGGYVDRPGPSTGVLDELQVDCLSIGGPAGRLVLVVAEVVCINEDLAAGVRRRVREALNDPDVDVWACATHTHSGPDVGCVAGGGPTPSEWRRRLGDAAVEAARAAVASERECAGRLHVGELRAVGSPRGHENAEHRVSVDVLSCVDVDGIVEGVLAVVPVHPTVLPAGSTLVSGDLTAAIRNALRPRLGSPWVVVATGAAGDISTRRTRRAQTPEECRRLGDEAAEQIARLMGTAPTSVWEADGGACSSRRDSVAMPVRRQDPTELKALRRSLQERHGVELRAGATATARTLETVLQGVDVAETHARWGAIDLSLSAARLGRLCLFGIGAEPFHSVRDDVRSRCADPAVVLGYANGHVGYLPDEDAYSEPGYEVLSSPFGPDAAATTVASLIDLLPDPTPTEDRVTATDAPEVNQLACARLMKAAIERVSETQTENISRAADLVVDAILNDGIIQVFGTGHSRSIAMEIAGRAGGLVPANALSIKDLVMYGGTAPSAILDPTIERDARLAQRILDLADTHPEDVFIIASNSGGNGSVVELALLAKGRGHQVIAVTSLEHTQHVVSRHESGKRLFEIADVVIDNCGVFGDAAMPLPAGGAIAATSSLTGVLIAQMLVAEVCGRLLRMGKEVPVLVSANVPGGDEHNEDLNERYGGRVRRSEP